MVYNEFNNKTCLKCGKNPAEKHFAVCEECRDLDGIRFCVRHNIFYLDTNPGCPLCEMGLPKILINRDKKYDFSELEVGTRVFIIGGEGRGHYGFIRSDRSLRDNYHIVLDKDIPVNTRELSHYCVAYREEIEVWPQDWSGTSPAFDPSDCTFRSDEGHGCSDSDNEQKVCAAEFCNFNDKK